LPYEAGGDGRFRRRAPNDAMPKVSKKAAVVSEKILDDGPANSSPYSSNATPEQR
jgi:hypothetical protein